MASSNDASADLLADLRKVCDPHLQNENQSKEATLRALRVMQQEIEGPTAYLRRTRFQPLLNMCQLIAIETGLLAAIAKRKGEHVDAATLAGEIHREEELISW
ncbi:MAG: hypothetical protein Q9174_003821 [Haloplaca sp. 1 TL-2023]